MTEEFWIPIDFNEDTNKKLYNAVLSCWTTHVFTLNRLNEYFKENAESYLLENFKRELALFLKKNKADLPAQSYSLMRAAEKTFPYFSENKKINKNGKFIPVKPIKSEDYKNIQIETRSVWRKYLALNNLITTAYGTLYLREETWADTIATQAEGMEIDFDAVPFFWYSVIVCLDGDNSKLRFNMHHPDSRFGRKAWKEKKNYVKRNA